MGKFQIKSILLGIGIGMILASVIGIIYTAGIEPRKDMSGEEIIRLARGLGMVKSSEVFLKEDTRGQDNTQGKDGAQEQAPGTQKPEAGKDNAADKSTKTGLETSSREITITVYQGDTSEKVADRLFTAGLLDDRGEFLERLDKSGLSTKILVGEYKIREGIRSEEIIRMITRTGK